MHPSGGQIHKSFGGIVSSLDPESRRRDRNTVERVYSSGMIDEQQKRKAFQQGNSLPRNYTGEISMISNYAGRNTSKVVHKIRKAIQQKRFHQNNNTLQDINLLETFIVSCKNLINSCSKLIKQHFSKYYNQDEDVKSVLIYKSELSRILSKVQKHNLSRLQQENQQLKTMIQKLKKITKERHKQSYQAPTSILSVSNAQALELTKSLIKQAFQPTDYFSFIRLLEVSQKQVKTTSLLKQKDLCLKSKQKQSQSLFDLKEEKNKIFHHLIHTIKQKYRNQKPIVKKLRQILRTLKVQINATSAMSLLELLEIKISNMRMELIPNLLQCNLGYTMEIKHLQQDLQTKMAQLNSYKDQLLTQSQNLTTLQKDNKSLENQLKSIQSMQNQSLKKLKQPQFNYQKMKKLEIDNKSFQNIINKQYSQLKRICKDHTVLNEETYQQVNFLELTQFLQICMMQNNTKIIQIQKQNALYISKIQDLQEEFQNVLKQKLKFQEEIQHLKNKSNAHENSYRQKLQLEKKKSNSQKYLTTINKMRQTFSMALNDYQCHVIRLNEQIKQYKKAISILQQKIKVRDEINRDIIQEKSTIEEQLENRLQLTGSLELSSMKLRKEKQQMDVKLQKMNQQYEQDQHIIYKLNLQKQQILIRISELQVENKILAQKNSNLEKDYQNFKENSQKALDDANLQQKKLKLKKINNQKIKVMLESIKWQICLLKQDLSQITNQINQYKKSDLVQELDSTLKRFIQQSQIVFNMMMKSFQQKLRSQQQIISQKIQVQIEKIHGLKIIQLFNKVLHHNICTPQIQSHTTLQYANTSTNTFRNQAKHQFSSTQIITFQDKCISTEQPQQLLKSIKKLKSDIDQHKIQYKNLMLEIPSSLSSLKEQIKQIQNSLLIFFNKHLSKQDELFLMLQNRLKLSSKPLELGEAIEAVQHFEIKQLNSSVITPNSYYETLQKMVQELLYNKVHLNLQQQIKALPQAQKDKINNHKKKIGQLQNQLTIKQELSEKVLELTKTVQILKLEQKNIEKKLKYYEQDVNEKENIIQELKSNNKQMLQCMQIPKNDTLSLIGEDDQFQIIQNEVVLFDLLDQSGICNDELEFTKCELTKVLKELSIVKGKFRVLDKNSRQIINYLKLSLINMIQAAQNSRDDSLTLKVLLSELKICKGNIK